MARTLIEAELLIAKYEEDGPAKLYYSLKRKAWEIADMMNSISLKSVPLDDPKDKTFERLRFMINDSSSIAAAVKALEDTVSITGDETKDVSKKRVTTPESMSNALGNTAGQQD